MFVSKFSRSFAVFKSRFVSTGAISRLHAYFGQGTGAILLDNVACTGTETRLVNCHSYPLGVHNCRHSEDAGVTCQGMYMYIHIIPLILNLLYAYCSIHEWLMHHIWIQIRIQLCFTHFT